MTTAKPTLNLTSKPETVSWPETHYVYLEKVGPFQQTAPQAWDEFQKLIPFICEHNQVNSYTSLYKVGPEHWEPFTTYMRFMQGYDDEAKKQSTPPGRLVYSKEIAIKSAPDEMVETYCAAGPLDKVRDRVEATAERADGLFLTPPTYFISPEELSEFQNRIIDAFGPEAP